MKLISRRECLVGGLLGAAAFLSLDLTLHPGAAAQARVGAPAPAFTLPASNGRTVSLADFKGKTLVLEWTNHDCPYVGKHYRGNNMQMLQKKWTARNIVWLTVISSAPGTQGYVTATEANKLTTDRNAAPSAVLLDPKGVTGRAYGARVTPHMFVISGDGMVVYAGGIDDKQSAQLEDLKTARNFIDNALTELSQGKPVSVTGARAYGCTVKYGS
jgi:peroxiredoxin